MESYKSRITNDNLIQIAFFILQYAKLRVYYNCLSKYMKPNSFELTDTDNIYMAINQESLDKCIRPEYKPLYDWEIFRFSSDLMDPV